MPDTENTNTTEAREIMVKRHQKLLFMHVSNVANEYARMTKFTELNRSKNAKEYNRQYVDEESETNDIIGYSEEFSYNFDQYINNAVHEKIAEITDQELTGDDAIVDIILLDLSGTSPYTAYKRSYAVIPDANDGEEAYTYSGSLKARSSLERGTATLSADKKTATFSSSNS